MLYFYVIFLILLQFLLIKLIKLLRLACFLALFSSHSPEKRCICSSLFIYNLLTTNTSSLVDVEVGWNCELL